jgi:hypothetical protein
MDDTVFMTNEFTTVSDGVWVAVIVIVVVVVVVVVVVYHHYQ